MGPCFPGHSCLLMGSSELIPYFHLLACMAFTLPNELPLSQCVSFFTFTLLVYSPSLPHPMLGGIYCCVGALLLTGNNPQEPFGVLCKTVL